MNIELTEEFVGELASMSPTVLGERLKDAFTGLVSEVVKARLATAEVGEVDALEELGAELEKGFAEELERIRAELERGAHDTSP